MVDYGVNFAMFVLYIFYFYFISIHSIWPQIIINIMALSGGPANVENLSAGGLQYDSVMFLGDVLVLNEDWCNRQRPGLVSL